MYSLAVVTFLINFNMMGSHQSQKIFWETLSSHILVKVIITFDFDFHRQDCWIIPISYSLHPHMWPWSMDLLVCSFSCNSFPVLDIVPSFSYLLLVAPASPHLCPLDLLVCSFSCNIFPVLDIVPSSWLHLLTRTCAPCPPVDGFPLHMWQASHNTFQFKTENSKIFGI